MIRTAAKCFFIFTAVMTIFAGTSIVFTKEAYASCPRPCQQPRCIREISGCSETCACISATEKNTTVTHIRNEFIAHREWMVGEFFANHILPALMLFTEQITAMSMHQVAAIGTFLDAKHQLETQRLFQQLTAQAHKDYHPSEGMCTFGTNVRSLAGSDRNMDLTAITISNRVLQRELLSGASLAGGGRTSDALSRMAQFRSLYCNQSDNANGLKLLCPSKTTNTGRENNDINFTQLLDTPLTLKLDFTAQGNADHASNTHNPSVSADEEDVFALAANLYAHDVAPTIAPAFLVDDNGEILSQGINHYMNIRAVAAKRSVAKNSFAAIAAMKAQGESEVQPYLYALVKEMGIPDAEVATYLGERPSYYAQMEILTKKLYQNPMFYTDLYDKPANVERKNVSMQAIELMQRRDMYRSSLRTEAILSVMLETALIEQQEKLTNEIRRLPQNGELITLPSIP